jgi:hypothetical protein
MRTAALIVLYIALGVLLVIGTVVRVRTLQRIAEVQREKPMRDRLKLAVPIAAFGVIVVVVYIALNT